MKSFSTKLIGMAGAALMFSSMAFAQNATCSSINAGGGFVRAEGLNEILPSFTINCTGGAAAATATIQIFLSPSVTVTSAIVTASTGATEIASSGGGTATVAGSTITISNVSIPAIVATGLTISNIRVNASTIPTVAGGTPANLSATTFISGANVTPVSLSPASPLAYVLNGLGASVVSADPNGTLTNRIATAAATVTNSISTYSTSTAFGVCSSLNTSSTTAGFPGFFVKVTEGFVNSFKPQGTIAASTGTESTTVTQAISATRFKVTISNVPTGLNLYAPVEVYQSSSTSTTAATSFAAATATAWAQISETATTSVALAAGSGNVPAAATTPNQFSSLLSFPAVLTQNTLSGGYGIAAGLFQVPVSNNTATIVYEIGSQQSGAIDSFVIPVYMNESGGTLATQSTPMSAAVSFAPIAAATVYPAFAVGSSTTTSSLTTFTQCSTTLLFPFVSNASGFETGIAISNTTLKSTPTGFLNGISTSVQSGVCNLAFYGTGGTNPSVVQAPNPNEGGTAAYNSAESYAFTLSQALAVNSANPATFTGFMIAQCNFQYAHGFAYITYGGLGTPNAIAMGYLAPIVGRGTTLGDSTVVF